MTVLKWTVLTLAFSSSFYLLPLKSYDRLPIVADYHLALFPTILNKSNDGIVKELKGL